MYILEREIEDKTDHSKSWTITTISIRGRKHEEIRNQGKTENVIIDVSSIEGNPT
jgi:hypothetical protein